MEEKINKRKIKMYKQLKGKKNYKKIKKEKKEKENQRIKISPFVQVKVGKKEKTKKVSPFQLVVVKIPWYRRAMRNIMSYFGYYYS